MTKKKDTSNNRNLGTLTLTKSFLSGMLKANGCLPADAKIVQVFEDEGDAVVVVRHESLPFVLVGAILPEIKLRPGKKTLKILKRKPDGPRKGKVRKNLSSAVHDWELD